MSANSKGILSSIIDPFSISAQMNNVGVLVVAYVAIVLNKKTGCIDEKNDNYLYFILYGSTLVSGGTLILTLLYFCGIIDYCINKVIPCSEVCLTLNTIGIYAIGVIYHFVATLYGLYYIFFGEES